MEKLKAKLLGCFKSLTIWFNGLLLAALPAADYLKASLPDIQQYINVDTFKTIGAAVVIVNILLRFRTKTALENK